MKNNGIALPRLSPASRDLTKEGRKSARKPNSAESSRISRDIARRNSTIIPSYHYRIYDLKRLKQNAARLTMEDKLILVNDKDEVVGFDEKVKIHREGLLHRAFSVFVLNSHGELLMQRRALTKYHSPGLWSNTCCGHPRPREHVTLAAQGRLQVEMGLACPLRPVGSFIYRADVGDGLVEHEFDHLLVGHSDIEPALNIEEAIGWKWVRFETLSREVSDDPKNFTSWLRIIMDTQAHKLAVAL